MPRRSPVSRLLLYALLGVASAAFLAPFAWMIVTSLKPIEQAMSLPPDWIPREYDAVLDGQRMEVTKDYELRQAGVVVELTAGEDAGRRAFRSAAEVAAAGSAPGWRVLHRVEPGWWHVTERLGLRAAGRTPRWDIVPPGAIATHLRFRWHNYPNALERMGGDTGADDPAARLGHVSFWVFLGNSLTVCVLGVIGTVLSNAIVAYGFARLRWRGRDAFFALTLATMMVPFPVLMVPLYGVFRGLGWIGTLLPLWVPAFFGSAFNIFLMRQFFRTIPEELSEAARIDGCSEWRIFWRIVLPLSKPVLATAALLHFLYAWNDFMAPLLYLTRKSTYTLSLALQSYESQTGGVQWHYLMAASAVTVLPVVVLFFFTQKVFIQGIATTGTKG